jgi:DNA-nicking Smr family endonuclease
MEKSGPEAVHIPIDGILDLHMFSPKEAASVVDEYILACIEKGIYEIRIIHGKGKGVLRRTVHSLLERHAHVLGFNLDTGPSGWGTTLVSLKREG